jgi:flagellar FliL protein
MKGKLLIIILAAVLFLGGGGGAYYFLVLGKKEPAEVTKKGHDEEGEDEAHASAEGHGGDEEHESTEEEEEEHSGGHDGGHGGKSGPTIEPFVVNLADPGSRRYLRLNMQLKLKKPEEDEPRLEARMPQVRDAVLLLLSSKTTDQLLGPEGKAALRQELIDQIDAILKKKKKKAVKNLYFTEFLIQ